VASAIDPVPPDVIIDTKAVTVRLDSLIMRVRAALGEACET
jgi:hypothetical protein